ncbi:40S ribosomal protein S10-1-like [Papaver somniferum]|uniref:40S ribosomal protein S10-1-like n=1 Tax=Papaver somniferum TaxID=3469 RepID=UPI000E70357B|nr:40S ribosomal protein S10-1-like [Papaver somniferum]
MDRDYPYYNVTASKEELPIRLNYLHWRNRQVEAMHLEKLRKWQTDTMFGLTLTVSPTPNDDGRRSHSSNFTRSNRSLHEIKETNRSWQESEETVIISENNRRDISKYMFQEGVLYAKKDFNLAKHPAIDVPNLQVIKLIQSFKSKEYVRETFAWMHYYWFLTNEGIEFLRNHLNLPPEVLPSTLKKSTVAKFAPQGDRRGPRGDGERPRFSGDRDGYRGGPRGTAGEGGEKGGAPEGFQPSFRNPSGGGGFGRGRGRGRAGPASSDLA